MIPTHRKLPRLLRILTLFFSTINIASGQELENIISAGETEFMLNCALCHGDDGKGTGPQAKKLSAKPNDLTILSKENGGSFPETMVYNIIDGRRVGDYHGQEMPIWGQHFKDIERDEISVEERIDSIIKFLKSIQVK